MKPTFDTRKPYGGLTRSLVIAIDVGTTFSGVSYAILEPGEVPKIHGVTRFPGQEHVAGNSKIPSILYYDKRGDLKAAGAEADANQIQALAEDENWHKVELFKLRLRPRTMTLSMNGLRLAPLPARKSPVHIFGDFLSYLYNCTTSFIETTHANGPALLDSVIPNHVEFVLAHPNGWEGAQQAKMRRAAVYGKLVSDTPEGRARIRFVTEGEASLHACVLSGLAADVLSSPSKHGFLIADAGGGTLDISSYAIKGTSPLVIEEIAPPDCVFAGSVFVSRRARDFFEQKLKGSQYGTPDSLDHITRQFDEKTKRLFRDRKEPQFVPFGSPFDKDPAFGIRNGQLRLTGAEVANLFEPSIDAAFNAIRKQIESAVGGSVKSVFLVGGYAASPWLFSQLKERLKALNIVVSRPDTQTSKAVADGAIGFYCDHHVSARMSKFTYGVEYLRQLDPNDPEHVAREAKLCELPSGPKLLPDAFDCILDRGVRVKESKVFSRKYCTELTSLSMLKVFEVEVWCYRGGNGIPKWIERSSDSFSTLCMVRADLSMLSDSAEPKQGKNGKTYWTIVFSVEIHFGLTEFEARIKWVQDGHTKYGPATIVFNERGHRSEEEEPDFYPEDDSISGSNSYSSSSRASDRDHHRSSSTRAKTPPEGHYVDSSRRSSRADSVIPEVARAPSTRPSASIPNTPRSSAHMSLDRSRDLTRDLENPRRRSGTPSISDHRSSRSNRSSVVVPLASIPTSPVPSSRPGTPGTPARGLADPPRSVVASPAKPDPAPLADTDPTPTNATPPGFHATPPPPAPTLSRAASSASAILGTRSPPKTLSVFGEDPKSVFGTPGTADFLNGAGVGLGIEGLNSTDRPASIFGEDLVPGGTAGGAPASLFGSPAPGMPGGLFDEAPVSSTPITEQPAPGGGWGFGFGAGIAKSIGSIRSGKSSAKASPAISRVPSTSAKVQSALSPLNPVAQEQQPPLGLESQPEASPVSAPEPAPTPTPEPAEAPMPTALPKIDTSVPASAVPSGLASALAESGAATPTSDAETPVTAGGTKKKKRKGAKRVEEEEKKKKEVEDKAKEEAEVATAADAAKKLQEEEVKAKAQAEEVAKQKAEAEMAAAAAAEAEAKKVQEEEDRKRLEEEAKKKEEEAKASKAKPLAKNLSKKEKKKQEDRERQEKEEKERLEKEEQKKNDDEEKERLMLLEEEKKKAESIRLEQERIAEEERKAEEAKKAEELRIEAERKAAEEKAEAERKAEEEKQRAASELLEKERLAEEEKKREEEIRVERERIEKMRLEEEQVQKELAELERQEKEAKEAEERRRQEKEAENQRLQEIQERERREKEARERKEREKKEREERERQSKPSLGFGGLWGGKATSFTSSLFGAVSPEPPQQEANESAFGWGGLSGGVKKKTSSTSLAKPTPPPLSRRSSRQFGQGGWGSTLGSSGFEFGSGGNNPTATNSFFGEADIGLNDLKNPAAALEHESEPPPPPAKDDHDTEDAWGFGDAKKDLAKEKPPQPPSPEALHHPYKGAEGVDGESAAEGAWGLSTLSGKDKKKKKGKAAELAGSELPTRTSSPAPPESSADGFATPMGVSEAEPEPTTADEDFGFPLKTKKKKKGKKGADIEGPSGAATPVPGAVGTGGDLGINVQEMLGDLLGGDAEQAATPTAEKEDDDWGLPVKTKKKKAKGGGKKK